MNLSIEEKLSSINARFDIIERLRYIEKKYKNYFKKLNINFRLIENYSQYFWSNSYLLKFTENVKYKIEVKNNEEIVIIREFDDFNLKNKNESLQYLINQMMKGIDNKVIDDIENILSKKSNFKNINQIKLFPKIPKFYFSEQSIEDFTGEIRGKISEINFRCDMDSKSFKFIRKRMD